MVKIQSFLHFCDCCEEKIQPQKRKNELGSSCVFFSRESWWADCSAYAVQALIWTRGEFFFLLFFILLVLCFLMYIGRFFDLGLIFLIHFVIWWADLRICVVFFHFFWVLGVCLLCSSAYVRLMSIFFLNQIVLFFRIDMSCFQVLSYFLFYASLL